MKFNTVINKSLLVISLIITGSSLDAFCNGGPVDGSAVYKTGDVILTDQPNIQLVKEDLNIKIDGDYSQVHVTYFLLNTSSSDQQITYGFPVDFMRTEMNYDFEWKEEYLPYFKFLLDDKLLDTEKKTATETTSVELIGLDKQPYQEPIKRRWQITSFKIGSEEIVKLEAKYKIKNSFTDWGTSKDFFPSLGDRSLLYDFSPAGSWGGGVVNSFTVSINYSDLLKNGGNIDVVGLDMSNESGMLLFNATNFNLKDSKSLKINYSQVNQGLSRYAWKNRMSKAHLMNYTVSSQLQGNYKKEYLFDGNFNTAWVEGKADNGVNESITIELDDYNLAAIGIVAGYTNKPKTYLANNRVKKILLEKEIVDHKDPNKTSIDSREVVLKDMALLGTLNKNNFYNLMNVVGEYGEGWQKVRKVTITILETYPGAKYDDTCISEIFLMGYQ